MSLDRIVQVNISRQTSVPSRQGFGEGAFVSEDAVFEPVITSYASATEVSSDSLAGAETEKASNLYFGQEIRPEKLYVIRKGQDLDHIQTITFDSDFVASNVINLDVDSAAVGPINFTTDHDTTIGLLAAAIAGEAGVDTAVVGGANNRTITVTGAAVNTLVALENLAVTGGASQPSGVIATTQYPDEVKTYVESIQRAQDINDDWYAIAIQSKTQTDQEAVAAWALPLIKLAFFSTDDADAYDAGVSTDLGSVLDNLTNERSVILYSGDSATTHPELAFMGGQLPTDPGSITWAFKELLGVNKDALTSAQISTLHSKNYNTYTDIGGLGVTEQGKVASGEYIDVIRGTDFLQVRIKENVFRLFANEPKVPYTNKGIAQIVNEVKAVLQQGVTQEILAEDPAPTVTAPDVADVPVADKGDRILRNVNFTGVLAGAIHKAIINGNVSL